MSVPCGYVRRMSSTRLSLEGCPGLYGIFLVLTFDWIRGLRSQISLLCVQLWAHSFILNSCIPYIYLTISVILGLCLAPHPLVVFLMPRNRHQTKSDEEAAKAKELEEFAQAYFKYTNLFQEQSDAMCHNPKGVAECGNCTNTHNFFFQP